MKNSGSMGLTGFVFSVIGVILLVLHAIGLPQVLGIIGLIIGALAVIFSLIQMGMSGRKDFAGVGLVLGIIVVVIEIILLA